MIFAKRLKFTDIIGPFNRKIKQYAYQKFNSGFFFTF